MGTPIVWRKKKTTVMENAHLYGTIHLLRKHIFRIFAPPPPLIKHVFSTERKQKLPFSNPLHPPFSFWKCLRNIWIVSMVYLRILHLYILLIVSYKILFCNMTCHFLPKKRSLSALCSFAIYFYDYESNKEQNVCIFSTEINGIYFILRCYRD